MKKAMALVLAKGGHESFEQGFCAMELSAWLAGEEFSDHPDCVSVGIAGGMRAMNDELPDPLRQQLIPLTLEVLGTKTSWEDEKTRAFMAADYAVRTVLPWMFGKLAKHGEPKYREAAREWAAKLIALPKIIDRKTAELGENAAREAQAFSYKASYAAASAYASSASAASASAYSSSASAAYASASAYAAYASASAAASSASSASLRSRFLAELLPGWMDLIRRMIAVGKDEKVKPVAKRAKLVFAQA